MNAHIKHQLIIDKNQQPAYVVLAYEDFQRLLYPVNVESGVPEAVVNLAFNQDCSALRAWREYLGFSADEAARKLGYSSADYQQLEARKTLEESTRESIAAAFGIQAEQLDF